MSVDKLVLQNTHTVISKGPRIRLYTITRVRIVSYHVYLMDLCYIPYCNEKHDVQREKENMHTICRKAISRDFFESDLPKPELSEEDFPAE